MLKLNTVLCTGGDCCNIKVGIKKKKIKPLSYKHSQKTPHTFVGFIFYFVTHCDCEPTVCKTVNIIYIPGINLH